MSTNNENKLTTVMTIIMIGLRDNDIIDTYIK